VHPGPVRQPPDLDRFLHDLRILAQSGAVF